MSEMPLVFFEVHEDVTVSSVQSASVLDAVNVSDTVAALMAQALVDTHASPVAAKSATSSTTLPVGWLSSTTVKGAVSAAFVSWVCIGVSRSVSVKPATSSSRFVTDVAWLATVS